MSPTDLVDDNEWPEYVVAAGAHPVGDGAVALHINGDSFVVDGGDVEALAEGLLEASDGSAPDPDSGVEVDLGP